MQSWHSTRLFLRDFATSPFMTLYEGSGSQSWQSWLEHLSRPWFPYLILVFLLLPAFCTISPHLLNDLNPFPHPLTQVNQIYIIMEGCHFGCMIGTKVAALLPQTLSFLGSPLTEGNYGPCSILEEKFTHSSKSDFSWEVSLGWTWRWYREYTLAVLKETALSLHLWEVDITHFPAACMIPHTSHFLSFAVLRRSEGLFLLYFVCTE